MPNRCIELHDSELEAISFAGAGAVLHFPHVYIHASEGRPGWDRGTGWSQEAFIRVGNAHVDGMFSKESRAAYDGVHCLSTGDLTIDGKHSHNTISIPLDMRGAVELSLECWGDTVRVSGDSIVLELVGEPEYIEEFPRLRNLMTGYTMKTLVLDAAGWQRRDDFYNAFFAAVGAPIWHGRNFDALRDSIAGGSINEVEVPYGLVVRNVAGIGAEASQIVQDFQNLVEKLAEEGTPVAITLER